MNNLSKCVAGLLVLAMPGLYFPGSAFCADARLSAEVDGKNITRHAPKIMSTPVREIPHWKPPVVEKKYIWMGLAGIVVVGGAAALMSGGDGGGGNDNPSSPTDAGSVAFNW